MRTMDKKERPQKDSIRTRFNRWRAKKNGKDESSTDAAKPIETTTTSPAKTTPSDPRRRSLSAKLIEAVHEFKETHEMQVSERGEEAEEVDVRVSEDDPRIKTLEQTGSFKVVEGGKRQSKETEAVIEVPGVWVTTANASEEPLPTE